MIANPKDGPLNIAVIRVDQTRVNTKNTDRKDRRRIRTEESDEVANDSHSRREGERKEATKTIKKRTTAKKNDVSS